MPSAEEFADGAEAGMTRELYDRGHGRPILECLEPRLLLDGIAEQEAIEALGKAGATAELK